MASPDRGPRSVDPRLLSDILARPKDDAPRLVLADALTGDGDPRGEFIVVQCMLAARGLSPGKRAELQRRAADLRSASSGGWTTHLGDLRFEMRRGFVDEVAGDAEELAKRAPQIFGVEPVTRLTVANATPETLGALANAGAFTRVLRLTVRGTIGDAGARVLAIALAARSAPIESLNVGNAGIQADGAEALATALKGCKALTLTGNSIGDAGLVALASSKALATLDTLFVAENDITDSGLETVAKVATFTLLTRLGVARNDDVTDDGLRRLAKSKKLKRLKWLEYTDQDEGAQKIVVR